MQTQCGIPPAGHGQSTHVSIDPFDLLERIRTREALADAIEDAIAYLDAVDGDPDLEPSLGGGGDLRNMSPEFVDLEDDDCDLEKTGDEEPDSDDEPSLGSFDRMVHQEHSYSQHAGWHCGLDREVDRSDFEDGGDTEPNGDELDLDGTEREPCLGAPEIGKDGSQERWAKGIHDDCEESPPSDPAFRLALAGRRGLPAPRTDLCLLVAE